MFALILEFMEIPFRELTLRSSQKRTRSAIPSGTEHHIIAILCSDPDCYQFTIECGGFGVQIVIEIFDSQAE